MTKRKVVPILAPDEEVRAIPGFEGLYSVSRTGNVWTHAKSMGLSRHGGRWLKAAVNHGYPMVALFKDQKQFMRRVHRLVAMAWIPNPENKPDINHINGLRADARVENLEWCTRSENLIHAWATGAKNDQRLFGQVQVHSIRTAASGGKTTAQLASELGVSQRCISDLVNRHTYTNY